jgi:hypothetical protein
MKGTFVVLLRCPLKGMTKLSLFFEEAHFGFKIIDGIKQAILFDFRGSSHLQGEYL